MLEYRARKWEPQPLTEEEIDRHAQRLLRGLADGCIFYHFRLLPEESLDAVVARLRVLAREAGVRLVVKRDTVEGRLRYRLRRRLDGE